MDKERENLRNAYIVNRVLLLEDLASALKGYTQVLAENKTHKASILYKDIEGKDQFYLVDQYTILGMLRIVRSLFKDLVREGQAELARSTLFENGWTSAKTKQLFRRWEINSKHKQE